MSRPEELFFFDPEMATEKYLRVRGSYRESHRRMKPLLELVRSLDIGYNHVAEALYDPLNAGFNVWASDEDHPESEEWEKAAKGMVTGAFTKPCAFVGTVLWRWDGETAQIVGLDFETTPYLIRDIRNGYPGGSWRENTEEALRNRDLELCWMKGKVDWLWEQSMAPEPLLSIYVKDQPWTCLSTR